ncbi:MAG: type II toxin-antitoxin system VapC family toxin [Limisphaerales bacterium]
MKSAGNYTKKLSQLFTATMQKLPLVAIDTNFPLLLAQENADAVDALEVLRERLRPAQILLPPTVLDELLFQSENESDKSLRDLAKFALLNLRSRWHFQLADLNSAQAKIAQEAARQILIKGILPREERNDAFIISESAVLDSILLVSNDSHLLQADHRQLGLLFRELDLPVPLIVSPREIVQKFYRK